MFLRLRRGGKRWSQRGYRKLQRRPLSLETLEGRALLATFVVTSTSDSGAGSLRQAILNANASIGTQTIDFNIPGTGVHTISPVSALPAITNPVVIDGYTQPGATPNTLANGDNAALEIVLDGSTAGANAAFGLHITAGGSTVRGLVIDNFGSPFTGDGILIDTNGGNTIAGNFIGIDPTGNFAAGNVNSGVNVGSANNTIGGTTPAARNVISGNNSEFPRESVGDGILISVSGATGTVVQGNFIGTDAEGTLFVPNYRIGVELDSVSGETIGGTTSGARNVISGNNEAIGIESSSRVVVQGNYIGTDVTGSVLLGNNRGVVIELNSSNNTVGGTAPGAGNVIAGNGVPGVCGSQDLKGTPRPATPFSPTRFSLTEVWAST